MAVHHYNFERPFTTNQGFITPINCMEVLPNENIRHKIDMLVRTQPLLAPVMGSLEVKIANFFVPARLCWDGWDDFITGGVDGNDDSTPPFIDMTGGSVIGSLFDHLGLAPSYEGQASALPIRAYQLIYNEFFRDQDLDQDGATVSLAGGEDNTTTTDLQRACWRKDYFTSARPDTQKGDDVEIALTGNAPVIGTDTAPKIDDTLAGAGHTVYTSNSGMTGSGAGNISSSSGIRWTETGMEADLSNVSAISVNDLRLATALQRYKENMLRYGSRYVERLQAAFGVKNLDARLNRPELLSTGKANIQFSEIIQSAPSIDDTSDESVGSLKGHGVNVTHARRYKYTAPEYGFIISVAVFRPKTSYLDGVPKMWTRTTKEDYFQPELQHIGMQPIYNKELKGDHADPDGIFGYQQRYDEYRYMFDQVSGEFRDTLKFWHMAREFGSDPALNDDFVRCEGVDRIFATDADEFQCRAFHKIRKKSKLDALGTPYVY
jgi:hypothetical protein